MADRSPPDRRGPMAVTSYERTESSFQGTPLDAELSALSAPFARQSVSHHYDCH